MHALKCPVNVTRTLVPSPRKVNLLVKSPPPRALMWNGVDVEQASYFVGKSITLFTIFYCGLNWVHYRELRKKQDDDDKSI